MTAATATSEKVIAATPAQRAWKAFYRDVIARWAWRIVLLLFFLAAFAPLLANNKPLLVIEPSGACNLPFAQSLTPIEWRFLIYVPLAAIVGWGIRGRARKQGIILLIAVVIVSAVEVHAWKQSDFLDTTDYAQLEAIKIYAPIPHGPYEQVDEAYLPPNASHWLGTDGLGRDLASRLLHGARVSLSVGFVAALLAVGIGTLIGAAAGYWGGRVDWALSRLVEVAECFPTFFLILTVIALVPANLFTVMAVIGLTGWTGVARLVRGEILRLSTEPFTAAARALGVRDWRILVRHLLPNAMGPILVSATFGVASAILIESSLSFLGLGVPPPIPTWGGLLAEARKAIEFAWWQAAFPGIAIFVTITAYNLIGESLRDVFDPKQINRGN